MFEEIAVGYASLFLVPYLGETGREPVARRPKMILADEDRTPGELVDLLQKRARIVPVINVMAGDVKEPSHADHIIRRHPAEPDTQIQMIRVVFAHRLDNHLQIFLESPEDEKFAPFRIVAFAEEPLQFALSRGIRTGEDTVHTLRFPSRPWRFVANEVSH